MGNWQPHVRFSGICILCGIDCTDALCSGCSLDLPYNRHSCPRCALPTPENRICARCLQKPPCFQSCTVMYNYQYPVDSLIREMKFKQHPEFAHVLGYHLAAKLGAHCKIQAEVLIPVPLHKYRLLQRGYNQSLELAKVLRRYLGIPIDNDCCQRIYDTPPQISLPARQRKANVRGAFSLSGTHDYQHILIVDDVITTGSTVNEIASLFVKAGIQSVSVCALARTGSGLD
ncbi:MAG: hypothetical protein A2W28_03030 [Gammaproteobacteria bacterium RBG_16_51_14]|nr:MAG: hypothetical protein A2W28_03030 [Gammaproteobacteria bacterium RBG_16_51_14]